MMSEKKSDGNVGARHGRKNSIMHTVFIEPEDYEKYHKTQ